MVGIKTLRRKYEKISVNEKCRWRTLLRFIAYIPYTSIYLRQKYYHGDFPTIASLWIFESFEWVTKAYMLRYLTYGLNVNIQGHLLWTVNQQGSE